MFWADTFNTCGTFSTNEPALRLNCPVGPKLVIRSEPSNRLAPKLRHRQHVGLVHGSDAALARFRARESVLGDALDLASRIGSRVRGALAAGTSSCDWLPAGSRDGVNSPGNIRLARCRERVYEGSVVLEHRSLKSCDLPLIVAAPHHDGFAIVRLALEAADFGCHHRAAL